MLKRLLTATCTSAESRRSLIRSRGCLLLGVRESRIYRSISLVSSTTNKTLRENIMTGDFALCLDCVRISQVLRSRPLSGSLTNPQFIVEARCSLTCYAFTVCSFERILSSSYISVSFKCFEFKVCYYTARTNWRRLLKIIRNHNHV